MAKDSDEYIRMRGTVTKMLPDSTFEVKLESGFELLAKPSGRMRRGRGIRVLPGSRLASLPLGSGDGQDQTSH
jgi:translation initiation factor IF-1